MRPKLAALHATQIERLLAFQRQDRAHWDLERANLLHGFAEERLRWERERTILLNRIDPSTRVHVEPELGVPLMVDPIPFDDDDEFWKDRESREELAERLYDEETRVMNGN